MTYIHIISSPFPHCTVTAAIGVDKVRASGRQRSQVNFQSSKGHRSRWNGLHIRYPPWTLKYGRLGGKVRT